MSAPLGDFVLMMSTTGVPEAPRLDDVARWPQWRGAPAQVQRRDLAPGLRLWTRGALALRDEAGEVIGVLGIVLFDRSSAHMQALTAQFARLQQDLQDARRELAAQRNQGGLARRTKYTLARFVGASPGACGGKR